MLLYLSVYFHDVSGAGSQSGENQDEEYNEERKKNDTSYNKGTKVLVSKETVGLRRPRGGVPCERSGMFVVSLRGVNDGFWCHLGFS